MYYLKTEVLVLVKRYSITFGSKGKILKTKESRHLSNWIQNMFVLPTNHDQSSILTTLAFLLPLLVIIET